MTIKRGEGNAIRRMCLPLCMLKLADAVSKRSMLRSFGIAACATAISRPRLRADQPQPRHSFERVVDLTHTLSPSFPTPWKDPLVLEQISKLGKGKWNILRWHLNEHIGTHLDAPLHCTGLDSADRIPVEQLVGSLVVVNIRIALLPTRIANSPSTTSNNGKRSTNEFRMERWWQCSVDGTPT